MPSHENKSEELATLRERLELAEQTLDAIRHGRVDALVIEGTSGDEIYTLSGADRPYRIMVEEMHEGALVLRKDAVILYCNRQLAGMVRTSPDKVLGTAFLDWLVEPGRGEFPSLLEQCVGKACRTEVCLRAADGTAVPVALALNPLPVDAVQLISVIAMDLTERKQHEARIQQRTVELAAVNRELEAFSYSVSHDLRAPLRHITGFIQMLQDHAAASHDEQSRRYMRLIRESADQMSALIDDLLVLSKIGRATMNQTDVDMRQLVDQGLEELTEETRGRTIHWRIGPLPHVRGDRSLLRTVLVNLLSNAIKYTRPRNPAVIEIGGREQEAEAVWYVRDNGVGFDMRFVHKLFGVFQRLHTEEEFEGTGIGLASVRRVIERHGGRTWAEGVIDGGAAFYFSLPRSSDKP